MGALIQKERVSLQPVVLTKEDTLNGGKCSDIFPFGYQDR